MKMNYTVTIINDISEAGAKRVKDFVVSNVLNDTFIFDIPLTGGTIKEMKLSELVKYREAQKSNSI